MIGDQLVSFELMIEVEILESLLDLVRGALRSEIRRGDTYL